MLRFKRKKNFLLVEVVIGIALFSICALPLLRQPFHIAQKSYDKLFEAELFRQAELMHCTILSDLQGGNITWGTLPKKPKGFFSFPQTRHEFHLGPHVHRNFTETATLKLKSTKTTPEEQEARLLELILTYAPLKGKKRYTFSYLITALGPVSPTKQVTELPGVSSG